MLLYFYSRYVVHIITFYNQAVSFECTYYRKMNVTPKKLPPSKAKVKCTLCSLVFCNKLYFLKNNWGKTHQRSKLDPDKHWIYVENRTEKTVWEKKRRQRDLDIHCGSWRLNLNYERLLLAPPFLLFGSSYFILGSPFLYSLKIDILS